MGDDSLILYAPYGEKAQRVCSPKYYWQNWQRESGQFVIIQQTHTGCGIFEWNGRTWEVPSDHAFVAIVPERSTYYWKSPLPWTFAWMNFYGSLANSLCTELRKQHGAALPLPIKSPAGSAFLELADATKNRTPPDRLDRSVACYGFFMEWLRQLNQTAEPDPVQAAIRICNNRFHAPLGVKELASETGLSREHFTRLFTERTGTSPARYLRHLRAKAARRLIASGSSTLSEVALRCGFPSVRTLHAALAES